MVDRERERQAELKRKREMKREVGRAREREMQAEKKRRMDEFVELPWYPLPYPPVSLAHTNDIHLFLSSFSWTSSPWSTYLSSPLFPPFIVTQLIRPMAWLFANPTLKHDNLAPI